MNVQLTVQSPVVLEPREFFGTSDLLEIMCASGLEAPPASVILLQCAAGATPPTTVNWPSKSEQLEGSTEVAPLGRQDRSGSGVLFFVRSSSCELQVCVSLRYSERQM